MGKATLTKSTAGGSQVYTPVTLTMAAADPTNKNQFVATGNDLIVIHNTDTSQHTVTVNSVADTFGRTKDIAAVAVAAGAYAIIGPLDLAGWVQTDGYVYLEADSNKVKLGIVIL